MARWVVMGWSGGDLGALGKLSAERSKGFSGGWPGKRSAGSLVGGLNFLVCCLGKWCVRDMMGGLVVVWLGAWRWVGWWAGGWSGDWSVLVKHV